LSRPASLRRLLLQVAVLAAVLAGLSRLAGRTVHPRDGGEDRASLSETSPAGRQTDEMSTSSPDLTFYRALGDARAPGGGPPVVPGHEDTSRRSPDPLPAGGAGVYVVQALATRDASAARGARERLAAHGFPATLSVDRGAGRPVYRVRVGRYRTRAEAEAAVRVLRQKQHLSPWILQEAE
jgi:hypothetical protein